MSVVAGCKGTSDKSCCVSTCWRGWDTETCQWTRGKWWCLVLSSLLISTLWCCWFYKLPEFSVWSPSSWEEEEKKNKILCRQRGLLQGNAVTQCLPLWLSWLTHGIHQVGQMIPAGVNSQSGCWYKIWPICYEINFSGRYRLFAVVLSKSLWRPVCWPNPRAAKLCR